MDLAVGSSLGTEVASGSSSSSRIDVLAGSGSLGGSGSCAWSVMGVGFSVLFLWRGVEVDV